MSQSPSITLRPMEPGDWPDVQDIYAQGIATGLATFTTDPGDWQHFQTDRLTTPRLVAVSEGAIAGWATLTAASDRCALSGVAEASVYVSESHRGKGIGRTLLDALITQSEAQGIWTIQAGIFRENQSSLALFAAAGFRTIGHRERFGTTPDGAWHDVIALERRSTQVGLPVTG